MAERHEGCRLFHVKICGLTTPADARLAAEAGADAIGLNFVPGSPRFIATGAARSVTAALPRDVLRVGVFAGATAEEILDTVKAVGLDAVQLHGHLLMESATGGPARDGGDLPGLCGRLGGLPVIRAVRLAAMPTDGPQADALAEARRWIEAAAALGSPPSMALVDAHAPAGTAAGRLGGTGATVDWGRLARTPPLPVPMALAGGLTPANVAAAILSTGLRAVDTASGVESAPGIKDPDRLRAFVAAARRAIFPA
jgi:phosphoribosylanthranilate isomerase